MSALAEVPSRVDNIIENEDISGPGIYGINLWALGVPITVYVDDYLPTIDNKLIFAS